MAAAQRWTIEQVAAAAPDERSLQAAKGLAARSVWSDLGATDSLVWGKCQGSGKSPYQVTVDLTEPAFRCTCPSRKFPCKHGLALLLLWSRADGVVADMANPADFADEWASERSDRAAKKAAKKAAEAPPDPEAQARRRAERMALMTAGLDDFERWMEDLVRQGLAAARRQPFAFWDGVAARLVDAQVPGLAERVRTAAALVHRPDDWAEALLAELGRWYLAVQAWRRRDGLDGATLADLRTYLGWARRAEEVAEEAPPVHDRWHVLGRRLGGDERLQSQRTWLWGEQCGELAVVLDFAATGAVLRTAEVVGSITEGDVVLYPGSPPRRALFVGPHSSVGSTASLPAAGSIKDAAERIADAVAANPWVDAIPVVLREVRPAVDGVVDEDHRFLPYADGVDVPVLLAVTGTRPVDLFGEWSDDGLHPMTVVVDGRMESL